MGDPETAAALRREDGTPVVTGDLVVIDGLADTLALVGADGARTSVTAQPGPRHHGLVRDSPIPIWPSDVVTASPG